MRIAITGATGLVGGNLADIGTSLGHEVVCTKRGSSKIAHLAHLSNLKWADADLSNEDGLTKAFEGADVVFHCAAYVDAGNAITDAMRETNIEGTKRVLNAVR